MTVFRGTLHHAGRGTDRATLGQGGDDLDSLFGLEEVRHSDVVLDRSGTVKIFFLDLRGNYRLAGDLRRELPMYNEDEGR